MKKILILTLAIALCLIPTTPAFPADELIYETFDNWKNPYLAKDWTAVSVGGWGGEFNQIYEATQEILDRYGELGAPLPVGGYGSIYRDFPAQPGKFYLVTFRDAKSMTIEGVNRPLLAMLPPGLAWIQLDVSDGRVIKTHGLTNAPGVVDKSFYSWYSGVLPLFSRISLHPAFQVHTEAAPLGTHHIRVIFQTKLQDYGAGAWVIRGPAIIDVNIYEGTAKYEEGKDLSLQPFTKIAGPFLVRNTEWRRGPDKPPDGWDFYSIVPYMRYMMRAMSGSSQGISCGGNSFEENKHIYRDFRVTAGQKYKLSVDIISNSTNFLGTRDPSPVRVWVQYNGPDIFGKEAVLSTHGIDGTQAGIKDNEWITVTVPGPGGATFTIAPTGTDHARIILQVMGGTGGGTVFDNVSFTRAE